MGPVASDSFEALEEGLVDALGAELDDQLVVVDGLDVAMLVDLLRLRNYNVSGTPTRGDPIS